MVATNYKIRCVLALLDNCVEEYVELIKSEVLSENAILSADTKDKWSTPFFLKERITQELKSDPTSDVMKINEFVFCPMPHKCLDKSKVDEFYDEEMYQVMKDGEKGLNFAKKIRMII